MNPPTLSIQEASLAFKENIIFEQLNLTIKAGQCLCLLGESGVGKSSLLRMIANLTTLASKSHSKITCDNSRPLRDQIAYMAQTDLLLPWLTAEDNALLYAKLHGKASKNEYARLEELFQLVGLTGTNHKYPHELSGGMRQRVALVRTLIQDKPIILMDEPFSALDAITRFQLQTLAADLIKNHTVLLVTHDPLEALRIADEIYILSGRPAQLNLAIKLSSDKPRDLDNPELKKYQAALYDALMRAKELNT